MKAVRNEGAIAAPMTPEMQDQNIETPARKKASSALGSAAVGAISMKDEDPVLRGGATRKQHPGVQLQSCGCVQGQRLQLTVPEKREAVVALAPGGTNQHPGRDQSPTQIRHRERSEEHTSEL